MKSMLIIVLFLTFVVENAKSNTAECVEIENTDLCASLEWNNGPYLNAYSSNIVRFKKVLSDGSITYDSPGQNIQFYGWMIMHHHAHGTRPVETINISPGIYENSKVYYMAGMIGTWQFKVSIDGVDYVLHELEI